MCGTVVVQLLIVCLFLDSFTCYQVEAKKTKTVPNRGRTKRAASVEIRFKSKLQSSKPVKDCCKIVRMMCKNRKMSPRSGCKTGESSEEEISITKTPAEVSSSVLQLAVYVNYSALSHFTLIAFDATSVCIDKLAYYQFQSQIDSSNYVCISALEFRQICILHQCCTERSILRFTG